MTLAQREKRRKLRRRKHIILTTLFLILTLTILVLLIGPDTIEAHEPVTVVVHVVKSGDSLWSVAECYDNNHMDLRRYIDVIQDYNKLDNTILQPGQRLKVPVFD